jgi:HK97 family phage portal protein
MNVTRPDPNGSVVYEYTITSSGEKVPFPPWEILHIPGLGFNGLMGLGIVTLAREGISCGLAHEEYAARFFTNNATPAGYLEVPGIVDPEEKAKIRADWYDVHGGVSRSQLIGIIAQGMKFNPVSVSSKDAQFMESRKFQVTEAARWLNLPPHMIYDLQQSTNNNIEQQSLEFIIYTIRPWLVCIEQAILLKLVQEDDVTVEHRVEGLLRGDTAAKTAYYTAGRQWGWLSRNDIRELENQEWIEGGDDYLVPMNMGILGADGKIINTNTPAPANGKDDQMQKLLEFMKKENQNQKEN